MSYHVQLFRHEVQAREQAHQGDDFFDHEENLLPFTAAQRQALHERLLRYGYRVQREQPGHTQYGKNDDEAHAQALLTDRGLYFSAGPADFDSVFDISMTASEFTDTGEFAKYDPQADGWEEV